MVVMRVMTELQEQYIEAIDRFTEDEYQSTYDGEPLNEVGVLYSTFDSYDMSEEHDVQVYANILDDAKPKLEVYCDGAHVFTEENTPEGFLSDVNSWDFDSLYYWACGICRQALNEEEEGDEVW